MSVFKVAEKFVSINGEGQRAGQLAVFIRFSGCNLACVYCDTAWARSEDIPCELMNTEQIIEYIKSTEVTNITLTGGEPLLREGIDNLIEKLVESGFWVEIETNGSVPLSPLGSNRPHFTMDYKLTDSGEEDKMLLSNFKILEKEDVVKFVCSSEGDLEKACEIIDTYSLKDKCKIYFSCVFEKLSPQKAVEFMIKHKLNGINFQLQMHKFIWNPDMKGV